MEWCIPDTLTSSVTRVDERTVMHNDWGPKSVPRGEVLTGAVQGYGHQLFLVTASRKLYLNSEDGVDAPVYVGPLLRMCYEEYSTVFVVIAGECGDFTMCFAGNARPAQYTVRCAVRRAVAGDNYCLEFAVVGDDAVALYGELLEYRFERPDAPPGQLRAEFKRALETRKLKRHPLEAELMWVDPKYRNRE